MPVALGVNGGVLGSNNLPTATTFRGVFTPNEVARAIALGFWPVNKSQAVTGVAGSGALGTLTVGSSAPPSVEYLVVAGGGGGGGYAGGGGAGGFRSGTNQAVSAGVSYAVTVGSGGAGGATSSTDGTQGGTSSFIGGAVSISSTGGGGGGNFNQVQAGSGGSGGGAGRGTAGTGISGDRKSVV